MDPRCHKGHPAPSARLCLLHQCLEWGQQREMGDRDGSAGIDLQQSKMFPKGKRFSKKAVERKTPKSRRLKAAPRLTLLVSIQERGKGKSTHKPQDLLQLYNFHTSHQFSSAAHSAFVPKLKAQNKKKVLLHSFRQTWAKSRHGPA